MTREVSIADMQPGDIILFRGKGFLFNALSPILALLRPYPEMIFPFRYGWKGNERVGRPWHLAFALEWHKKHGWIIGESIARGVTPTYLNKYIIAGNIPIVIRWFDKPPRPIKLREFMAAHSDTKYSAMAYVWTALQVLLPWFPRIVTSRVTCWQNVFRMCRWCGKPIQELHKYPLITDFLEAAEGADNVLET